MKEKTTVRRYFCIVAATLSLTGPAIAVPVDNGVTGRIENVTTLGSPAFDVKAELDPNENFANRLGKNEYGLGGGWFHTGIWQGQATITYNFLEKGTDNPIALNPFAVKISDIDREGGNGLGNEIFRVNNVKQVRVTPDSILDVNVLNPSEKRVEITANGKTNGNDKNAAILNFDGGTGFKLDYETTKGWSAANNGGGISILAPNGGESFTTIAAQPSASVPEPATLTLLCTALLGLGITFTRRQSLSNRIT